MNVASIAVIGAGRMGSQHIAACQSMPGVCKVALIVDPDPLVRERYEQIGVPTTAFLDDASFEGVELVIVASPTSTHVDVLKSLALLNVKLLVEKPCATSVEGFNQLDETIERGKATFHAGYWRRFSEPFRRLRAVIAEGSIGKPRMALACQWDATPPLLTATPVSVTGGIGIDCGVHETDMLGWLGLGSVGRLHKVIPEGSLDWVQPGDSDQLSCTASTTQGVVATIALSRTAGGTDEIHWKVIGEQGSAEVRLGPVGALQLTTCNGRRTEETFYGDPIFLALRAQVSAIIHGQDEMAATLLDARAAILPWLD